MNIIDNKSFQIAQLCNDFNVEKLYLFGSVLTDRFTDESDIDFIVRFGKVDLYNYFDNYMDLKFRLEDLLGRNVDLLEEQTIKNPYLKNTIDRTKQLIYG